MAFAAGQHLGAAADRVVDQLGTLLRCFVDQRPDLVSVLGAAPDLHRAHPLGQLLGELVGHRLVHVEAVGGRAGLTDVAHLRQHRALHRGVEVGVLEHQERGVAAELHRQPQHLSRPDCSISLRPTSVEPVNDSLRSAGVRSAAARSPARMLRGDHVQHAARQARLLEDLAPAPASTAASAGPA
jgi:hypothetical protein